MAGVLRQPSCASPWLVQSMVGFCASPQKGHVSNTPFWAGCQEKLSLFYMTKQSIPASLVYRRAFGRQTIVPYMIERLRYLEKRSDIVGQPHSTCGIGVLTSSIGVV